PGQHRRHRDHDHGGLLHFLVEAAGQAGVQGSEAGTNGDRPDRRRPCGVGRYFFGLPGAWRTLPREAKPPHSAAQVSWLASGDSPAPWRRLPCSANIAPCGSIQRVIQCPGVSSNGPCTTLPPPVLTAVVAVSMSATLK